MSVIKKCIERAQLTVDELAFAAGVSRVTASKWINGRSKPHALIRKRVNNLLVRINGAVDAGKLPADGERCVVRERVVDADGNIRIPPIYVRTAVMEALHITLPS